MMTITHKSLLALAMGLLISGYAGLVSAAPAKKPLLNKNQFSIGAGVSINSIDRPFGADDDETGFQLFGAYNLAGVNLMENVDTSIEFGYMDYGFFNADGVWVTFVVDGKITGELGWLARLGLDLGDDDGIMLGAGVGYSLSKKLDARLEYVVRDTIDSVQLNFVFAL